MRHIVGHDTGEEHGRGADESVAAALLAESREFIPLEDACLRLRMTEERRTRNVQKHGVVEVDGGHAGRPHLRQGPYGTPGDLVGPDLTAVLYDLLPELRRERRRMRTVPLRVKPNKIRLLGFLPGGEVPFIPSAVVVRRHLQQDGNEGVDHNGIFGAPPTPQFESVVGVTNPPKPARKTGEGIREGLLGKRRDVGGKDRRHGRKRNRCKLRHSQILVIESSSFST